jgi:hypothetical protein
MEKEQKQSPYPWDEAPEWANYAATDWDGQMYWFANEPKKITTWVGQGGSTRHIKSAGIVIPNAEETLESRPK